VTEVDEVDEMDVADEVVRCATETDTLAFGERIGTHAQPGDLILLSGELGAGKTVLVRGIATGMGVDPALVRSPTFVLHHVYRAGPRLLHHIDLYRLGPGADIRLLDVDEMLESGGVVVVEWGEHSELLGRAHLRLAFAIEGDGTRVITPGADAPEHLTPAWSHE
jgi:tRNA threonylcarbamoyladenosine biosynthesis protein TsaE